MLQAAINGRREIVADNLLSLKSSALRRGAQNKDVARLEVLFAAANNSTLWSNLSMVKAKGGSRPTYQRILFEGSVLARGVYKMLDSQEARDYLVQFLLPCVELSGAY